MKNVNTLVFLLYLLSLLSACNFLSNNIPQPASSSDNLPLATCPKIIPTPPPKPRFLIWIAPTGTITQSKYERMLENSESIYAKISARGIDQSIIDSIDNDRDLKLSERVKLLVDNNKFDGLPSNLTDELVSDGPFGFSWAIPLEAGYHQAKLIVNTDTGETIEYEWSFCITP